jgi:hypothetical protein
MTKQITFNILLEKNQDIFVAHCLEMGLVATSLDKMDVVSKMTKMIQRQWSFAERHNRLSDVFRPVSNEMWRKFLMTKAAVANTKQAVTTAEAGNGVELSQNAYAAAVC